MPSHNICFNVIFIVLSAFCCSQVKGQELEVDRVKLIVLDAGHGGKDPGAIFNGVREKDITLAIVRRLGRIIQEEIPGVKVVYTREKDVFIPLHGRAERANDVKADLFLSVHCNYFHKNKGKHGSETYVMGLHKIKDNLLVAKRENEVVKLESDAGHHYDFDVNTPTGHIFLSMYQNASLDRSIRLADHIEHALSVHLNNPSRGVKQAGFYVLYRTSMPSVLVETGFLTNPNDRKMLTTEDGQHRIAQSLFDAIVQYKAEVEGRPPSAFVTSTHTVSSQGRYSSPKYKRNNAGKPSRRYTVQIAATSKPKIELMRSIKGCRQEREGNFYKYKVGQFSDFEAAEQCRRNMIRKGFDGAFIISY